MLPFDVKSLEENMGKVFALYQSFQYAIKTITYIKRTNPTATFTIVKKGATNGLRRKEDMPAQSRLMAPIPSPLKPEPSCCAVTVFGYARHTHEKYVKVLKRYPGSA